MTKCSTGRAPGRSAVRLLPLTARLLHLQRVERYAAQVPPVHPQDELVRPRLGQGQVLDVHHHLGEDGYARRGPALLIESEPRLHRLSDGLVVGVDEDQLDLMGTRLRGVSLDPDEQ